MMRAPQPSSVAPVAFASRAASRSGAWRAGRPYAWPRSQISSSRTASSDRHALQLRRLARADPVVGGSDRRGHGGASRPWEARDRRRHGGRPDASGVRGTAVDGRVEQPVGSRADRGSRDSGRVHDRRSAERPGIVGVTPRPLCRSGTRAPPGGHLLSARRPHRYGPSPRNRCHQPQPRLEFPRSAARGDREHRVRHRLTGRRRLGERPFPRQPARVPGQPSARAHHRGHRPDRSSCLLLERIALRRPRRSRPGDPRRGAARGVRLIQRDELRDPLTAGAAAWVWTARPTLGVTQLFDLMRSSAQDIETPGFDPYTGFGRLDIPARSPPRPSRPTRTSRTTTSTHQAETALREATPAELSSAATGERCRRLDFGEDQRDVYRVWVAGRRVTAITISPTADVDLALWGPRTTNVFESGGLQGEPEGALGKAWYARRESVRVRNTRRGAYYYVEAYLGSSPPVRRVERRLQAHGLDRGDQDPARRR